MSLKANLEGLARTVLRQRVNSNALALNAQEDYVAQTTAHCEAARTVFATAMTEQGPDSFPRFEQAFAQLATDSVASYRNTYVEQARSLPSSTFAPVETNLPSPVLYLPPVSIASGVLRQLRSLCSPGLTTQQRVSEADRAVAEANAGVLGGLTGMLVYGAVPESPSAAAAAVTATALAHLFDTYLRKRDAAARAHFDAQILPAVNQQYADTLRLCRRDAAELTLAREEYSLPSR